MKTQTAPFSLTKKTLAICTSILLAFTLSVPVFLNSGTSTPTQAYATPTTQEQAEEALTKLNSLQQQMGEAENSYNQAIIDKDNAQQKVDEAQARIDECNSQITDLQGKLSNRARSMYRSGSASLLDLIFGATSFTEFATNWGILQTLNENDENLVSESKSLRSEITEQKITLDEQKTIAEQKEAEASKVYEQAQQLVSTQQAVYDNLSEQAKQELEVARNSQVVSESSASYATSGYSNNSNNVNNNKSQTVTGGTVLSRAYAEIGKPYVWGGVGPDGYDCSGFVSYCLTGRHTRLGTSSTFMGWTRVSDPQPGDVVVNSGHAGIYVGGGQMVHAADYQYGVCQSPLSWMGGSYIFVRY